MQDQLRAYIIINAEDVSEAQRYAMLVALAGDVLPPPEHEENPPSVDSPKTTQHPYLDELTDQIILGDITPDEAHRLWEEFVNKQE